MPVVQICNDFSDAVPLYLPLDLYLKPVATLTISVLIPRAKSVNFTVSTKAVMDNIKSWVSPDVFCSLKVISESPEELKFEGEIMNKNNVQNIIAKLNEKVFKHLGFPSVKVRARSIGPSFPCTEDWEMFFRDAKFLEEVRPGERPDTIHISYIPCEWISEKNLRPSESLLKNVFEKFGDIAAVDIPTNDPYRAEMSPEFSGIQLLSDYEGEVCEAYLQFRDYMSFVCAMDALRGMKLMIKTHERAFIANIKVDFDKTKHLSENSSRRRDLERSRLKAKRAKDKLFAKERKQIEATSLRLLRKKDPVKAKIERRRRREERRKAKELKRIKSNEISKLNRKIASEEQRLIIAKRKLESIRLLTELFARLKKHHEVIQSKSRAVPSRGLSDSITPIMFDYSDGDKTEQVKVNYNDTGGDDINGPFFRRGDN